MNLCGRLARLERLAGRRRAPVTGIDAAAVICAGIWLEDVRQRGLTVREALARGEQPPDGSDVDMLLGAEVALSEAGMLP